MCVCVSLSLSVGFRVIFFFFWGENVCVYFRTIMFFGCRENVPKENKIVTLVFVIFHKNVLHLLFLSLIYLFLFVGFRVIFRWWWLEIKLGEDLGLVRIFLIWYSSFCMLLFFSVFVWIIFQKRCWLIYYPKLSAFCTFVIVILWITYPY